MRNAGREKISIATRSVLTTKHNNSPLLRFAVVSDCLCCAVSIWSLFPLPLRNGRADGWMEGAVTKRRRFHFHSVLDFWLFFFSGEENEEESGMLSLAPTSATHAIYCTTHTHARACTFRVTVATPRLF